IDNIGGDTDGYYYLYIAENNGISVYRANKQNETILTLLFSMPSISNVKYAAEDLYFISNDTLYMYCDNLGLAPLVKYSAFTIGEGDLYNIYVNE
ncbi:MAG: hypothetical protein WC343_15490, partial [Bacilli bacterium]